MRTRVVCAITALALAMVPTQVGSAQAGQTTATGAALTAADVHLIIAQAVGRAQQLRVAATIAVTDREGNILGVFQMAAAPAAATMTAGRPADPDGLEQVTLPAGGAAAAVSKAGTAAYLSSQGMAATTRTASFVVQEHFPPGQPSFEGGPLFGVQFSQLPCSDVVAQSLPLGLSGDPGGMPIYRGGAPVGGVGVEADGVYSAGPTVGDADTPVEEDIARAATPGFEAPAAIRADQISIDGTRLPYVETAQVPAPAPAALDGGTMLVAVRSAPESRYLASTLDAPEFGFDVSAQKARTAAFFSRPDAGAILAGAGQGRYVDAAAADGILLDGDVAVSTRALGALSRPFFPDGQDGTANGPFAKPISVFSPFNTGLQSALVRSALVQGAVGVPVSGCTGVSALGNGIQSFAGGVPLMRNGTLVGAIGISGDGIDQDDLISMAGGAGFQPPPEMTSDQVMVRGVRLPYVKLPRHPVQTGTVRAVWS